MNTFTRRLGGPSRKIIAHTLFSPQKSMEIFKNILRLKCPLQDQISLKYLLKSPFYGDTYKDISISQKMTILCLLEKVTFIFSEG